MGIIKLPQRRMYWSYKTRVDLIASSMSINRFEEIVSVIHFNDNNKLPNRDSPLYNKCFKVQPLIDHFLNYTIQRCPFFEAVPPYKIKKVGVQNVGNGWYFWLCV